MVYPTKSDREKLKELNNKKPCDWKDWWEMGFIEGKAKGYKAGYKTAKNKYFPKAR